MNNIELYKILGIPLDVEDKLISYGHSRNIQLPDEVFRKIIMRNQWDEGIKELQNLLGDDPDGIKILWELLNIITNYSYIEYNKRSIPNNVFIDTMKICSRFLNDHFNTYQKYQFVWAWWLPREISLNEFRLGALEYEFVDGPNREIAIHIPSDADLSTESVYNSIKAFQGFMKMYFPDWLHVKMTCDTWMLMPELKEMLDKGSNIIAFQNMFEIEAVDHEATWYMGWIYPGVESIDDNLPEKTTLQRNIKKYLLAGNKFGVAKGHLKNEIFTPLD